jgi:hypothetical protein
MGPFSEERQYQRAESIKRLLDTNPQLDPVYKAMWQDKLKGLALNESTYNFRVKTIYSQMQKEPWVK